MKKYLIPFVLSLLLGCAEKEPEPIPAAVFSIEKMTNILLDIQLIEAGIVIRKYNKTQRTEQIIEYYIALFKKHNVSQENFKTSLRFYTDHPDLLEEIYEDILEKLSELEAEVQNEKSDSTSTQEEPDVKETKQDVRRKGIMKFRKKTGKGPRKNPRKN